MENRKLYYTMAEVAEMFDVNQSLIRYWDKEFSIIKRVDEPNGKKVNRLFRPKDIDSFRLIYHLIKEKGMTIEGAKRFIAKQKLEPVGKDIAVIEKLENIKFILSDVLSRFKEESSNWEVKYEDE